MEEGRTHTTWLTPERCHWLGSSPCRRSSSYLARFVIVGRQSEVRGQTPQAADVARCATPPARRAISGKPLPSNRVRFRQRLCDDLAPAESPVSRVGVRRSFRRSGLLPYGRGSEGRSLTTSTVSACGRCVRAAGPNDGRRRGRTACRGRRDGDCWAGRERRHAAAGHGLCRCAGDRLTVGIDAARVSRRRNGRGRCERRNPRREGRSRFGLGRMAR